MDSYRKLFVLMLELALRYCDQTGAAQHMLLISAKDQQLWLRQLLVTQAQACAQSQSWRLCAKLMQAMKGRFCGRFCCRKKNLSKFPVSDLVSG